MDTGLTTIPEADIEKHRATAQSMITRIVVLENSSRESGTALAGTGRRFVSTVSAGSVRKTREVELAKTVAAVRPDDQLLSIAQHTLLYRARRGIAIALAVADVFSRAGELESLQAKNARAPLEGDDASRFKKLLSASAYVSAFAFASYLLAADRQRRRGAQRHQGTRLPVRHAAGCAEVDGRRTGRGTWRHEGRCRSRPARPQLRARRHRRAADAQGPLRRPRRIRERAYPHRCRRLHARRLRRRARQALQAAGDDLQEARRGRRQPHRQSTSRSSSPRC